ncbi:MAG TPA: nucleotidyltransferase family protein [Actinomycetota bacterium]|nr:nucleotidyltransferase family protein [Actinomycetota bacterium]
MSPTPERWIHELLRGAARREIAPHVAGGRSELEWAAALRAAAGHGMQGWLARELRGIETVPWGSQMLLQSTALRIAADHRTHLHNAACALDLLDAADVEAMILKGPALVERYYDDPTLRPYGDIDVYVRPPAFARALAALEAGGFSLLDRNWEFLHGDLRGQVHLHSPQERSLELHWHIVNGARQRRTLGMAPDELWDVVEPASVGGRKCFGLPPSEEIAHLCLHAAGHGCSRLIWLADIATLTAGRDIDWDAVGARARRWRFGAGTFFVLSLVREWFVAPIPDEALAQLRPGRATTAAFQRAIARWDLIRSDEGRLRELMFVAAADDVRTRASLLTDVIVPAPGQRPSIQGPSWLRGLHRITLGTAGRVLGKFGLSEDLLAEYEPVDQQRHDRAGFLSAVAAQRSAVRSAVAVVSPSASVGMAHYSRALVEAMDESLPATLFDGSHTSRLQICRHLRRLARDPHVAVLVTSPHWTVPIMLFRLRTRGGFVFHDPILDAASRLTRPLHRLYYRILTRKLGVIILHGAKFRKPVLQMRLRPRAIVTVPHGFVPHELEVDAPYDPTGRILFIGRAQPYKGLAVLTEALALIPDVSVVIAGENVEDPHAPPVPNVEVRSGRLSDAEFRGLIADCSAVVLPYERANQSGVLATAFRASRPVIASAVGAFAEYVDDGVNGYLVPPGDSVALANAIVRLTDDPARAAEMAVAARRSWEEALSPRVCARTICAALGVGEPVKKP